MPKAKDGCVSPSKGPIVPESEQADPQVAPATPKEEKMGVQVGKPAPDFEASAYVDGGFKNITLSDYKGQWVVLCFYPGDFTFV